MAKLPNAEKAIIDIEKIRGYVRSSTHPLGRFKADFFAGLGYSSENCNEFEKNLRNSIKAQDAKELEESEYGRKYVVSGYFNSPSDANVKIPTVWIILRGETILRFITAYTGGTG